MTDDQNMSMSKEQGIKKVLKGPRHTVILGAGASIASTIHNPGPSGKKLPSMENFIEVVGLADILKIGDSGSKNINFEKIYSQIHNQDPNSLVLNKIEKRVSDYFSSLTLPTTPTIYDYLILALRPKDLIATFNWDPFLYQAFCRNQPFARPPHLSFLHGNIAIGYSPEDQRAGPAGWFSKATGHEFVPTRLLYPITQKDYNSDEFIAHEWNRLRTWLKNSKRITFFGYGAPGTDIEAIQLMSNAWGTPQQRNLEQIEIIDIQPREVVTKRWNRFIHTHHYDYCSSYFQSVLALFPRRTGERFMHQFFPFTPAEAFQEPNPIPENFDTLDSLWDWHRPLIEAEDQHGENQE